MIMLIPSVVLADYKYNDAVKKTDTYIFAYSNYARFIRIKDNTKYGYNNGSPEMLGDFKTGGFLTVEEYNITDAETVSWLAPGIEYWLVGKSKLDTRLTTGTDDDKSGVRVTEYVLHNVKVTGTGSIANPWVFSDGSVVKIGVTDKTIGQISPDGGYEHVTPEDGDKEFVLTYDPGNQFNTSACESIAASQGASFSVTNGLEANQKIIKVGNIKSNFSCFINFSMDCYQITFNNDGGNGGLGGTSIYYHYGKGWFEDFACKTPLSISITKPTKTGYTYAGYPYPGDASKLLVNTANPPKIVPGIKDTAVTAGTSKAKWNAITYTIGYELDGGSVSGNPTSKAYDSEINLTNPTKTVKVSFSEGSSGATINYTGAAANNSVHSYTFAGWASSSGDGLNTSTAKTGSSSGSATTDWTGSATTNRYFKNLRSSTGEVKLTAKWTSPTITLPKVTKTGHTCKWVSDTYEYSSGGTYKPLDSGGATQRAFTASCSANTFTVEFDGNGATAGSNSSFNCTYGGNCKLPTNGFVKTNHTFTGWKKNNAGDLKQPNDSISTESTGETIKYYAQWKQSYTIVLNYNGYFRTDDDGNSRTGSYSTDRTNWKVYFLSNGTLNITTLETNVDFFAVGGGGSGSVYGEYGAGGGGGYTKTAKNKSISKNSNYSITIGAGGAAVTRPEGTDADGKSGGTTSVYLGATQIIAAAGGEGGKDGKYSYRPTGWTEGTAIAHYSKGGSGGSGGGSADSGVGGSNGGNGGGWVKVAGGVGQGSTTSEFGESGATLYAGGGGASCNAAGGSGGGGKGGCFGDYDCNSGACAGAANTGGGGGGKSVWGASGAGGSGIVVMRNAR